MITVISTGFAAPTKDKCLESVRRQVGVDVEHIYVEASDQERPLSALMNVLNAAASLPPDRVVALLDGDDWLSRDTALAIVQAHHDAGAWVTYGSFQYSDGRPGFTSPYLSTETVRQAQWRGSHLKTVRAGLLQYVMDDCPEELRNEPWPWDMIMMFAAIEMAGWERVRYIRDVLYTYNFRNSHEYTTDQKGRAKTAELEKIVRDLPAYTQIESL